MWSVDTSMVLGCRGPLQIRDVIEYSPRLLAGAHFYAPYQSQKESLLNNALYLNQSKGLNYGIERPRLTKRRIVHCLKQNRAEKLKRSA